VALRARRAGQFQAGDLAVHELRQPAAVEAALGIFAAPDVGCAQGVQAGAHHHVGQGGNGQRIDQAQARERGQGFGVDRGVGGSGVPGQADCQERRGQEGGESGQGKTDFSRRWSHCDTSKSGVGGVADCVRPAKVWCAYNETMRHFNGLTFFCIYGLLLGRSMQMPGACRGVSGAARLRHNPGNLPAGTLFSGNPQYDS